MSSFITGNVPPPVMSECRRRMFLPAKASRRERVHVSQLRTPRALKRCEKGLRGVILYFTPLAPLDMYSKPRERTRALGKGRTNSNNSNNDNKHVNDNDTILNAERNRNKRFRRKREIEAKRCFRLVATPVSRHVACVRVRMWVIDCCNMAGGQDRACWAGLGRKVRRRGS